VSAHLDLALVAPLLALPVVGVGVALVTRGPRWLARRFGVVR
jgi:hypothetical protein